MRLGRRRTLEPTREDPASAPGCPLLSVRGVSWGGWVHRRSRPPSWAVLGGPHRGPVRGCRGTPVGVPAGAQPGVSRDPDGGLGRSSTWGCRGTPMGVPAGARPGGHGGALRELGARLPWWRVDIKRMGASFEGAPVAGPRHQQLPPSMVSLEIPRTAYAVGRPRGAPPGAVRHGAGGRPRAHRWLKSGFEGSQGYRLKRIRKGAPSSGA
jgi:hypothetical protein